VLKVSSLFKAVVFVTFGVPKVLRDVVLCKRTVKDHKWYNLGYEEMG
jgi:hypothetical protein